MKDRSGNLTCFNSNIDEDGHTVLAFHDTRRCVLPDLDHGWTATHQEANFNRPNNTFHETFSDGFVRVNDITEQPDNGVENATEDQTMNFYNQGELPFYYGLAQNFAISDRYFSSVLGPTFPNRSFLLAATAFGHLTTSEVGPPTAGTNQSRARFLTCSIRTMSLGETIFLTYPREPASGCSARRAPIRIFCR